jgi:hypothetical protein
MVVDGATEATLLASSMKSAVIPIAGRPQKAFERASAIDLARRESFEVGDKPTGIEGLSPDLLRYLDDLHAENENTIQKLHDIIERLAALASKVNVLSGSLPERMRSKFQADIQRDTSLLQGSVMVAYLSVVPDDRSRFSGELGIENFKRNFLTTDEYSPDQSAHVEAEAKVAELIDRYLASDVKNGNSLRKSLERKRKALATAEAFASSQPLSARANADVVRAELETTLVHEKLRKAEATARTEFDGLMAAFWAIDDAIHSIHELLKETAVHFVSTRELNRRNKSEVEAVRPKWLNSLRVAWFRTRLSLRPKTSEFKR